MPQKYGHLANAAAAATEKPPCVVCGLDPPRFSWTDLHGEGYCTQCGTPYQLAGGDLRPGESYPRCNMKDEALPVLREFWEQERRGNGLGTFMGFGDYPDQRDDRRAFNAWVEQAHPELAST